MVARTPLARNVGLQNRLVVELLPVFEKVLMLGLNSDNAFTAVVLVHCVPVYFVGSVACGQNAEALVPPSA